MCVGRRTKLIDRATIINNILHVYAAPTCCCVRVDKPQSTRKAHITCGDYYYFYRFHHLQREGERVCSRSTPLAYQLGHSLVFCHIWTMSTPISFKSFVLTAMHRNSWWNCKFYARKSWKCRNCCSQTIVDKYCWSTATLRIGVMNWKLRRLLIFTPVFSDHWPKSAPFFRGTREAITIRASAKGQWPQWVYHDSHLAIWSITSQFPIVERTFQIFNVRVNHNQKSRSQRSTESNIVNLQINDEPGEHLHWPGGHTFPAMVLVTSLTYCRSKSTQWQW